MLGYAYDFRGGKCLKTYSVLCLGRHRAVFIDDWCVHLVIRNRPSYAGGVNFLEI